MEITNKDLFQTLISKELRKEQIISNDPDTIWLTLRTIIEKAVSTENKANSKKVVPKQPWITDATLRLVKERRNLKEKGLQNKERQEVYKQLNKDIKRSCKYDKNNYYNGLCQDVQRYAEVGNSKQLFQTIKSITKQMKLQCWNLVNKVGRKLTNIEEILEEWRSYCGELFDDASSLTMNDETLMTNKEPCIMREEIIKAIRSLKDGKATTTDRIGAEVLKAMGDPGIDLIHLLCQTIWDTGIWPKEWCRSVFVPIHKKGAKDKCDNYRLIALIPHASKILLYILNDRLGAFLDHQIPREQTGFVKGKGTREHLLNLRQLIEKAREFNLTLYICFIDYRKAFDSVKWKDLWEIISEMGVSQHLIKIIRNLYEGSNGVVQVDKQQSEEFKPKRGVRQGCILSPRLFNIYSEQVMRKALEEGAEGFKINGELITNLRYADDTAILASNEEDLIKMINRLQNFSVKYGLMFNTSKTKVMIIDRSNNNRLDRKDIGGFEVVSQYTYLGAQINNMGNSAPEIERRIQLAKAAMNSLQKIWRSRHLSYNTKEKIVRTLVFPILLYGAESWTIKERERRKIDAFEMWCWRRMLRIPWTAKRSNISILRQLGIQIRLSKFVLQLVLKYYGHITRRDNNSMEKLTVEGCVEGSRPRGRSPKRWIDQVKMTINIPIQQINHAAQNRSEWRKIIDKSLNQTE